MIRTLCLNLYFFALAGCAGGQGQSYPVRLDLERIAAETAARSPTPGFSTLAR